jgi:hypothetical protein
MKSLSIKSGAILIGFIIFGCAHERQAEWKMLYEYDEGIMFYATDKVIVSSKNTVRVWTRLRYNSAFVSKMVKKYGYEFLRAAYSEQLIDVNCAEHKIMLWDSYMFSNKSELLMHTPPRSEWMSPPPESPMEYLYKEVCPLPEFREGIKH